MLARDRNQPCIIMWSLGNEAGGCGMALGAMAGLLRAADPTRPIHYEVLPLPPRETMAGLLK